jgi:glutamine amidotransferase
MCRHLAWLGAPRPLADFVTVPSHSLVVQSYAARELLRGTVCADGFGIGWYPEDGAPPARYRRELPIWADMDLREVSTAIRTTAAVAAVRNATPGISGGVASTQPVLADGILASHNGFIDGFAGHARGLRDRLSEDLYGALTGESDSETLLLLAIEHVRREGSMAAGLEAAFAEVMAVSPGSAICVVMTDGRELVAARMAGGGPCDSLYVRHLPDGVVVASEALDADSGWEPIPAEAVTRVAERTGSEVHRGR